MMHIYDEVFSCESINCHPINVCRLSELIWINLFMKYAMHIYVMQCERETRPSFCISAHWLVWREFDWIVITQRNSKYLWSRLHESQEIWFNGKLGLKFKYKNLLRILGCKKYLFNLMKFFSFKKIDKKYCKKKILKRWQLFQDWKVKFYTLKEDFQFTKG